MARQETQQASRYSAIPNESFVMSEISDDGLSFPNTKVLPRKQDRIPVRRDRFVEEVYRVQT